MIADRPDAAYEICTKYAPSCSGAQMHVNGNSWTIRSSTTNNSNKEDIPRASVNVEKKALVNRGNTQAKDLSSSLGAFGASSSSSSSSYGFHSDGAAMSRDNSGESDGLGLGLHGEEDYYDSLSSGDENESNQTVTSLPPEPVYNPEPGIDDYDSNKNVNEEVIDTEQVASSSNTSSFSTVVNGVKIKSLPGPRGIKGDKGDKGDMGPKGDSGREGKFFKKKTKS